MRVARDPNVPQGHQQKTVDRIYELTTLEDPPFRLVLGVDSHAVMKGHMERVQQDMDRFASWSRDLKESREEWLRARAVEPKL